MPDRFRIGFVLAVFVALSAAFAVRVPMFEGPDEPSNLEYLRFIDIEGRLAAPSAELTRELEVLERGILPPLWFLVTLPVYRALGMDEWSATPVRNPEFLRDPSYLADASAQGLGEEDILSAPYSRLQFLHGRDEAAPRSDAVKDLIVLRLLATAWAVLALWFSYLAFARAFYSPRRALAYTAFLAWTPQLAFISANINMDSMLAALGALFFWSAVEWQHASSQRRRMVFAALAGLAVGLAAEVKLNGLVLVIPLVFVALQSWRLRRWRESLVAAAGLTLVLAPFYLWGYLQSGHPLWTWNYQIISPLHHPPGQVPAIWNFEGAWNYHLVLFLTWFADIGWTSVWFGRWVSYPVMALFALGVLAAVQRVAKCRDTQESVRWTLGFFFFSSLAILAAELWFNLRFSQPQGRHLYPFLTVVAFPVAFGLERLRILWPMAWLLLALSVAAFPELVGRLRPQGWNEAAWVAATNQGRAALVHGPGSVDWDPESMVESGSSLTWQTQPNHTYEVLMSVDNPSFADRPWAPDGSLLRSSVAFAQPLSGAAEIPQRFWKMLSPGSRLAFQVLEYDNEGLLTGRSQVLERKR